MVFISTINKFYQANSKLYLFIGLNFINLIVAKYFRNIQHFEIPPWLRLWTYLSLISLSIGIYILFIKKKKIILSNLTLVWLLLLVIETLLFFVLGMPLALKKNFVLPELPSNHIASKLGSVMYADSTIHKVLLNGSDTVFNVHYTVDHLHKRVTPDYDSVKKEYALFFGCSIAFGEGLEDNQTFAYQIQQKSKRYNSYNFSCSSTGSNYMLALLQNISLKSQVREEKGKAFYIFFWDHMYRSIGAMDRYTSWMHMSPYYYLKNGKIVHEKMFKDGRPIISTIYENIYQSNIVKYFQLDFPLSLNDTHFDLVTEMIAESKRCYEKQFGNDEFYVVLYPNYVEYTEEQLNTLKRFLKQKHIKFVDLTKVIKYSVKYTLGGDPHPNANTNKLLSNSLLNEMKKMNK
jgi:hypothetical protein